MLANLHIIHTQSFFSRYKYLGSRLIFSKYFKEHTIFRALQKRISCVAVASTYSRLGKDDNSSVNCCSENWIQFSISIRFKLQQHLIDVIAMFGSTSQQFEMFRLIKFVHIIKSVIWNLGIVASTSGVPLINAV